ncbi:unnamed protein product [Moneuplotes crassus]|uniref:B box-type domain-containing protein n=1 Tax=Euplotes crassus TaxID=5936 RepID=A0AAD1XIS0_EUPCR|nr:unnamed protein product [Moneuplotes crassus]
MEADTLALSSCCTSTNILVTMITFSIKLEMRCLYCPENTKNEQMTEDRKITREYLHYCYDNHGPDYTAEAPVTQNKFEDTKDVSQNLLNPETEFCDHHVNKKNHYCIDCSMHLCYRCLKIKNPHLNHKCTRLKTLTLRLNTKVCSQSTMSS